MTTTTPMPEAADSLPDASPAAPASAASASSSPFDAFISYKRTDIAFARALEKALNAFTPPKDLVDLPQRRLRVFRDEGDLTGTEYFAAIDGYLRRSNKLIVICSPSARASTFVEDEIRRFVAHHGATHVVPVLLAGLPNHEAVAAGAAEMAFPDALVAALAMPLAVGYRGYDSAREKVDRGRFEGSWYTLLANIYGCSREEIEQRDRVRRTRRRNVLIAMGSAVAVSLATLTAVAYWQKLQADVQRNVALRGLARYLAYTADQSDGPLGALLLAIESVRTTRDVDGSVTVEAANALRQALVAIGGEPVGGRGDRVRQAVFSDDGKRLATIEDDGRLDLWDLARPLRSPGPVSTLPGAAKAAGRRITALSVDGRWLAISEPGVEGAMLWDGGNPASAPHPLHARVGPGVTALGFSPDAQWLAAADAEANVHLVQLDAPQAKPRVLAGHGTRRGPRGELLGLQGHAFDPQSRWLYTCAAVPSCRMWDLMSPQGAPQLLDGASVSGTARFSADGTWLATTLDSGARPGAVGLWRLDDRRQWQRVDLTLPKSVGASPSSRNLTIVGFTAAPLHLVANSGGQTHLWALDAETPVHRSIIGHTALLDREARRLAVVTPTNASRSGSTGSGSEAVSIVDIVGVVDATTEIRTLPWFEADVSQLSFDASGSRLGLVTRDGRVKVAAIDTNSRPAWQVLRGTDTEGVSIHFGADGRFIFAAAMGREFSVRAWQTDNASGDPVKLDAGASGVLEYSSVKRGSGRGAPRGGMQHAVAIDPRGRWLAIPGRKGIALLINLAEPAAPPLVLDGHAEEVTGAVFGPGGEWLATADRSHTVRIWRPAEPGRESVVLPPAPTRDEFGNSGKSSVSAIAASADGRYIATGGVLGYVALWRLDAPDSAPRMLRAHEGWVTALEFAADGTRLLSAGDDGKLALWKLDDVAAERPEWSFDAHRDGVSQARFVDKDRQIISAGADGVIRIWKANEPKGAPTELRGHAAEVIDFAVDAAGGMLLSGGLDGSVRLWNLAAPERPQQAAADRRPLVNTVAMSRDGRWIAAAADINDDIRLWASDQLSEPPQRLQIDISEGISGNSINYWGLRFTDDGRWLIAIAGGQLHRWRVDVQEQMDLACHLAGRNLSYGFWRAHLDRVPYRLTCPAAGLPPGWMSTADELAKEGEIQQAVAMYETASALQPELVPEPGRRAAKIGFDAHVESAREQVRVGRTDSALSMYATARAIDPTRVLDAAVEVDRLQRAHKLENEARHKGSVGDVDAAAEKFKEALALDPLIGVDPQLEARRLSAPGLRQRGDALAREGKADQAVVLYEQAFRYGIAALHEPRRRADQIRADALVAQADRLGNDGDLDGATRLYAQALALKPALGYDPVAKGRTLVAEHRWRAASRLVDEGRINEAAAVYREAWQLHPKRWVSASDLKELCWRAAKQDIAKTVLDLCDLAVSALPAVSIRDSRGIARLLAGDRQGAIDDLRATVEAGDRSDMSAPDVEARRTLLERLRAGARFTRFQELLDAGIRP